MSGRETTMLKKGADGTSWTGRLRDRYGDRVVRWRMRGCDALGAHVVLRGSPFVLNHGEIFIGDHFSLSSIPVPSHLFVTGRLRIGHHVRIGTGAAISCWGEIDIEDDVSIGAFAIILDTNFHTPGDFAASAVPKFIRIAKGVRIGHHVVVLPGTTVGAGAVVKAGSVVSGDVAKNAVVEGNPARVRLDPGGATDARGAAADDVPRLVMHVLGLSSVPDIHAGPGQIPQWDSLGALRLFVALEETFGVALAEDQLKTVRSIRELVQHVAAAQQRAENQAAPR